jgi:uncharacterized protein YjbJ (UPF0337 family)
MEWESIETIWKQRTDSIKQRWGRLTDKQIAAIAGKREKLIEKLQEVYGVTREEADRQVREWARGFEDHPSDD